MGGGMLDERDRRVLADIEQRLSAADPAFARRMRAPDCPFPAVPVLAAGAFLALPFLGLFLGPRAVLVAINVMAVAVMIVLVFRSRKPW
ncbi:hypothetical protein Acy02nite_33970 [Actinoplanes cyaneus]|uniref:DUF3040 domain-containing protein n=2 Tax=Actinoplanes cyaneus TaxID=52696 RepID=A0A919IJ98_9ACTN|nr:hypothetical protein Acy02nite_33970 [Actinoplanes cyaneus]